MTFILENKMAVIFCLRPDNSYTINNFVGFLEDTSEKQKEEKIGLVRIDNEQTFKYFENKVYESINYIITLKGNWHIRKCVEFERRNKDS